MSRNINQLPRSEISEFNDSLIDHVIFNVRHDFLVAGIDQSTLEQLKQMWRSKMQKISEVRPTTPIPNMAKISGGTQTKKDAVQAKTSGNISGSSSSKVKEKALSNVSARFPLTIKWVWQPNKVPQIVVPRPLVEGLQLRGNMNLSAALQLDGGLAPIEEESSDEEPEVLELEPKGDDDGSSLNSDDDPIEEDATDEDKFKAENMIICQFDKVSHLRNKWKFEFSDGIMYINGKGYVFKKCSGAASW